MPKLSSLFLLIVSLSAWGAEITPSPGTYELLAGSSMTFDGRPKEGQSKPQSYEWQIFSGEGAYLDNPNQARVTFHAPAAIEEESRSYTLQLTLGYASGKTSSAQIRVRVHRKNPKVVVRERSPWLHVSMGFGFGYLWGGWWPYPPLIVIPCPPPDFILLPHEVAPIALPVADDPAYGEWMAANPEWAGLVEESMSIPEELSELDMQEFFDGEGEAYDSTGETDPGQPAEAIPPGDGGGEPGYSGSPEPVSEPLVETPPAVETVAEPAPAIEPVDPLDPVEMPDDAVLDDMDGMEMEAW